MCHDDFLILSNLSLLTKIKQEEKIYIIRNNSINKINFEINIDKSYIPKFSRWFNNQGKNETIDVLNKLIDVSIEQYLFYSEKNDNITMNKYKNLLKGTITGLSNLKFTYKNDELVINNIDNIITKIEKLNISL
jgi:hypothetical protein